MRPFFRTIPAIALGVLAAAPGAHAQQPPGANPTTYIVAYVDATPAGRAQTATLLRQFAEASRKEAGAMRIEALQRIAPSNQFVILEVWKDQASLDAHAAATKQLHEKLTPYLISPVDERLCVASFGLPTAAPPARSALYVVTHVDVPGTFREKTVPALQTLADVSRKEAGNLRFDVTHQKTRTNHFTVVEVWKDQKSGDTHEVAAHTKEFLTQLTPMTGALYDQRLYKAL